MAAQRSVLIFRAEVRANAFDSCFIDKKTLVDKCIEFHNSERRWPLHHNDKIQMHGKEYGIGEKFIRIQRNPDKFLTEELIRQLKEKDPLWILNLTERKTLKKLEKCFDFFKKNRSKWPTDCKKNKKYPLDLDGGEEEETFDLGQFWNRVKSGITTIAESSYQEILKLDSTIIINKKRKRED